MPRPRPAKRRVLWLSWKDRGHPTAGGAEVVLHELIKRQVAAGDEVTVLTAAYTGAATHDRLDGATIIRVGGNRYLHSLQAAWYYRRHLYDQFDTVIEVVNTAPYLTSLMPGRARAGMLYHQMAGEVWDYEAPRPLNYIGRYLMEPAATRMLAQAQRAIVLSMSPSTTADLRRHGFGTRPIHQLTEGITLTPLGSLQDVQKYDSPTVLSLGAIRSMKRTLDQIAAFELAKLHIPALRLKMAGAAHGTYGKRVLQAIAASPHAADIEYLGPVTEAAKRELMQRCHAIMVTSVKEGWGLIVSEANGQGTPAVVYDADGLRDSVRHEETGIVTRATPDALADGLVRLLSNHGRYEHLRRQAYAFAKTLTFDATYADLKRALSD